MTITPDMATLINTFPLGFVATVTEEGRPALSPKGTFLVLNDRRVAFGNIRSPGTLSNLDNNPSVEINFIDQWKRKGVRLGGKASIIRRSDADFSDLHPLWAEKWADLAKRISAIVITDVERAEWIITPPYDDGATEEEMIALYKQKFAEIYP